jgi:hypothetical protein
MRQRRIGPKPSPSGWVNVRLGSAPQTGRDSHPYYKVLWKYSGLSGRIRIVGTVPARWAGLG